MVGRGARHLILLSRSGAKGAGTKALEFIRELEAQGVSIAAPATNIGDLALLTRELGRLASLMPPIRGCIQAAVAFRVRQPLPTNRPSDIEADVNDHVGCSVPKHDL